MKGKTKLKDETAFKISYWIFILSACYFSFVAKDISKMLICLLISAIYRGFLYIGSILNKNKNKKEKQDEQSNHGLQKP